MDPDKQSLRQRNLEKLRRAKEKMSQFREVLELAERILGEKYRRKVKGFPSAPISDLKKAKIQMEGGFPYLNPGDISLIPSQIRDYFSRLLKVFEEVIPAKHEALRKAMGPKNFVLDQFFARLLKNELAEKELQEEWGPEGSLLLFFLVQTLKPTLEIQAEQWRANLKDLSWSHGYCPFCGGLAGMGEIREEGRRFLHCQLCGTEWEYPRMKCPYCQNEDQDKLTYFQVEGEVGNRVDICLVCRQYLKTIDSREMEKPLDFDVEDFLTLHLDHLAQEEGYVRPEKLFIEVR